MTSFLKGVPNHVLEFLGAAAHAVLTELDDQKLFSCGMALIKEAKT